MAKWAHSDVLDYGLNKALTDADEIRLLKAYTAGDTWATVNSNTIASATVTDADFQITSSGSNRVLTLLNAKSDSSGVLASGATPNLHVAFVNAAATQVLVVTDETTDVEVSAGDTVNFPSGIAYTANQPT